MVQDESSEKTKQHEMPVVLQNLPPAETLNQMIDNLNFLSLLMDEAFTSISSQILSERKKIDLISSRVTKASLKTELISKHPNRATTVYSSSIFPSSVNDKNEQIDSTLINVITDIDHIPRPKYKLSVEQRLERAPITDTLRLFGRLTERTKYKHKYIIRGLGNLPSKITSVSDCLLFNTDENPYMKYDTTDNLSKNLRNRFYNNQLNNNNDNNNEDLDKLTDAPKTIKEKNRLMDGDTYDIAYHPEMGDVPRFSVNTTLSGLGGLALDIGWQGTKSSNQKIAPSSVSFQDLPELHIAPDMLPGFDEIDDAFGDLADINIPPPPTNAAPPPNGIDSSSSVTTSGVPAPVPPPIPPEIHVQPNDVGAEYRNNGMTNSNVTQVPAAPQAPLAPAAPAKEPSPEAGGGGGGGRSDLLAAIRAGRKLKSSKANRKPSKKAAAEKPKALSLMDHLKMKLQARNKVMRGETDASGKSGDAPGLPSLSKDVASSKDERDDLGISNVPDTMRMAMHFNHDDDGQSSGADEEWDDD